MAYRITGSELAISSLGFEEKLCKSWVCTKALFRKSLNKSCFDDMMT